MMRMSWQDSHNVSGRLLMLLLPQMAPASHQFNILRLHDTHRVNEAHVRQRQSPGGEGLHKGVRL